MSISHMVYEAIYSWPHVSLLYQLDIGSIDQYTPGNLRADYNATGCSIPPTTSPFIEEACCCIPNKTLTVVTRLTTSVFSEHINLKKNIQIAQLTTQIKLNWIHESWVKILFYIKERTIQINVTTSLYSHTNTVEHNMAPMTDVKPSILKLGNSSK